MAKTNQKIENVISETESESKHSLSASNLVNETILPSVSVEVTSEGKQVTWTDSDIGNFLKNQVKINASNEKINGQLVSLDNDKFHCIVLGVTEKVQDYISKSDFSECNGAVKSKVLGDVFDKVLYGAGRMDKSAESNSHISSIYQQQKKARDYVSMTDYQSGEKLSDWGKRYALLVADLTGEYCIKLNESEKARKRLNKSLKLEIGLKPAELKMLEKVLKAHESNVAELKTIDKKAKADKAKKK